MVNRIKRQVTTTNNLSRSVANVKRSRAFISELARKQSSSSPRREGFTLVELLVVITIIGILSGIGVAVFTNIQKRGRDAQRRADLRRMQEAVEQYYADNNEYPSTNNAWWAQCVSGSIQVKQGTCQSNSIIDGICSDYIEAVPVDPKFGMVTDSRCYFYRSNGTNYKILAYRTVETLNPVPSTDEMYDPRSVDRADRRISFAVYSPGARDW